MKNIISILFFIAAIAIFVMWTMPFLTEINVLRLEKDSFDNALADSRELQGLRDNLLNDYNSIPIEDLSRLYKIVPQVPEPIKLTVQLSNIAQATGVVVNKVRVQETKGSFGAVGQVVDLDMTFSASYESFRSFLSELENSLRLINVDYISFTSGDVNFYNFIVKAEAYFRKVPESDGVDVELLGQERILGQEFVSIINKLRTIKIDTDFFSSTAFRSLKDMTPIIGPAEEVGRDNPFLPI